MRKWYVVAAESPLSGADTATFTLSDPGDEEHATVAPYALVGPYSNTHAVTVAPSGFTVALSVAELCVIAVACCVATTGSVGGGVVNDRSVDPAEPPAFLATRWKW